MSVSKKNSKLLGVLILGDFLSTRGTSRSVSEDMADRLEAQGYSVLRASLCSNKYMRLFDRLYTAISRRHAYDVGYCDVFSGPAFVWAEVACWAMRRVRRPYILTLHGGDLPAFSKRWPRRVRRLLASAYAVTVPSQYLYEQMRVYRNDLIVLPNAIDLNCYSFRHRRIPVARLVWIRAFCEIYNPSMAPRVIAFLHREFPDIRLVMVGADKGDGSLQLCRSTAKELGVLECIEFLGCVPKSAIPDVLDQNDIFINTTNVDNVPVSVIEGMASGLCIVSTNAGGLPHLLKHEKDALLVNIDDAEAMAAAVRRLLVEPGLAERLSYDAYSKVEHFDWSKVLPQWEQLLADAVASKGVPNFSTEHVTTVSQKP